jgi:3-deoxy-D-manno-octulosonic-acid transferase
VTGLFPRHSHRLGAWEKKLDGLGLKWLLRSTVTGPVHPGAVILWDTFGELTYAYELAHAVFTGGSLAPLGGQNFLEPLICGVIPVSGPSWYDFDWAVEEILANNLLRIVNSPEQLAAQLMDMLVDPPDRTEVRSWVLDYVRSRQGGTRQACEEINKTLQGSDKPPV